MSFFDIFRKKVVAKPIDFQVVEKVSGDYGDFKKRLKKSSMIILVTGKRGSGKTALGFKLLEILVGERKAYYLGEAKLPGFIKKASDIKDVKNNSVVLVDEAAIAYSSRASMKKTNKVLSEIMVIARHKNLSLIIITQNSAMIDLNIIRLADTLIFKEPSLLQSRFERKGILDLFNKAEKHFSKIKEKGKKPYFYVIDDEFEGILKGGLPSFWSEEISKSYEGF